MSTSIAADTGDLSFFSLFYIYIYIYYYYYYFYDPYILYYCNRGVDLIKDELCIMCFYRLYMITNC